MRVNPCDTEDHWYVSLGPDSTETSRDRDHADLTLTGSAADLYVKLWNRTPATNLEMSGNTGLVDLWQANFRVRWG